MTGFHNMIKVVLTNFALAEGNGFIVTCKFLSEWKYTVKTITMWFYCNL